MFLKNFLHITVFLLVLGVRAQADFLPPSEMVEDDRLDQVYRDSPSLSLNLSSFSDRFELNGVIVGLHGQEPMGVQESKKNILMFDMENQEELEHNLSMMFMRRHPMEKTGRILTYIGVPLAIIGGIMVAGADELYYECVNGDCTGDARGGFGVVALGAGIGLSATGTVLWIIGSKK